jgi:hypothetical protein
VKRVGKKRCKEGTTNDAMGQLLTCCYFSSYFGGGATAAPIPPLTGPIGMEKRRRPRPIRNDSFFES